MSGYEQTETVEFERAATVAPQPLIDPFGRAITYLRALGNIAIVLVEQYLDFARELGDHFAVMDRGQVVYASVRADIDEKALKRALAI